MSDLKNPVLMAQVGAPHGIKGEVRVKSFTGDPLALGDYGALRTSDGERMKIMRLRQSKNVVIVKFKGINFRDEAEAIRGKELFVDRSALPDDTQEDEFYINDLVGMDVLDTEGKLVGRIHDVPDFGAGTLLEIAPSLDNQQFVTSKTWLLEFTKLNVPQINLEKRVVTIVLPDEVSERE